MTQITTHRARYARAGVAAAAIAAISATGLSMALWSAETTLPSHIDFQAGSLEITVNGDGEWLDDATAVPVDESTTVDPGDAFTYTETMLLGISGDLTAELVVDDILATGDAELLGTLQVERTVTMDGEVIDPASTIVTSADDGAEVVVEARVELPEETEVGQGQSVSLTDIDASLTQVPYTP